MKRTIKSYTPQLSKLEKSQFLSVVVPYNQQKDAFLAKYADLKWLPFVNSKTNQRKLRDQLTAGKFKSPFGLQDRQWKLALEEALDTISRYWEANISILKHDYLYQHDGLTDKERHYANLLLFKHPKSGRDFNRIIAIYQNEDMVFPGCELDALKRKKIRHYLHRTLRKITGKRPRVQVRRSIYCDSQTYKIKLNKKTEQPELIVTSTTPHKRFTFPLTGYFLSQGNARLVYDSVKNRIEVHQTREVKMKQLGSNVSAADFGTTEVMFSEQGVAYGDQFGRLLNRYNAYLLEKGKTRNQLVALFSNTKDPEKVKRIQKHNLSSTQRDRRHQKERAALENEINRAYRAFLIPNKLKRVGFEDLSDMRGKAKYKGLSRRVSLWTRTYLKDRLLFFEKLFDLDVVMVNPAYTSQECHECHYTSRDNRNGDYFHCKHCGHKNHADKNAAKNIQSRMDDIMIKNYMKSIEVKKVLIARHEQWKIKNARKKIKNTSKTA